MAHSPCSILPCARALTWVNASFYGECVNAFRGAGSNLARAAFLACAAAARAQPVILSTTCGEFRGINPEFLTNIMVMDIQPEMSGAVRNNVNANAAWLNRYVGCREAERGMSALRQPGRSKQGQTLLSGADVNLLPRHWQSKIVRAPRQKACCQRLLAPAT
jgi:hypothetical protein